MKAVPGWSAPLGKNSLLWAKACVVHRSSYVAQVLDGGLRDGDVLEGPGTHVAGPGLDDLRADDPVGLLVPLHVDQLVQVGRRSHRHDAVQLLVGLVAQLIGHDPGPQGGVATLAVAQDRELVAGLGQAGPALAVLGVRLQRVHGVVDVPRLLRSHRVGLLVGGRAIDGDAQVIRHHDDVAR